MLEGVREGSNNRDAGVGEIGGTGEGMEKPDWAGGSSIGNNREPGAWWRGRRVRGQGGGSSSNSSSRKAGGGEAGYPCHKSPCKLVGLAFVVACSQQCNNMY